MQKDTYIILRESKSDSYRMETFYLRYGKQLYAYAVKNWKTDEDTAWDLIYKTYDKISKTIDRYSFTSEEKFASFTTTIWEENKIIDDTTQSKRIDKNIINSIVKNQNVEFTKNISDSSWDNPNSPKLIASFTENKWGLYDICGNAAEMISIPNKTKGGSWASGAYFMQIRNEEKWDGSPSDCVGFRLVQSYLGRHTDNETQDNNDY